MSLASIPLSLYIHMPWCIKKCPYCDFNSHQIRQNDSEENYINALIEDAKNEATLIDQRPIHSVFVGGGTPSLISAKGYETLFNALNTIFTLPKDIEITLEANPSSVEANRFKDYRAIGINRLSMGVQSFDDNALKTLGRVHNSQDAKAAIQTAIAAGFDNFNIDIMHGLPKQTVPLALKDLETALSFSPTHLSWYQLTIEPNTLFYKTQPKLPDENTLFDIEKTGKEKLSNFNHYEISAFCQNNQYSRHNMNYWQFGDYLGIGAGACGKISFKDKIIRRQKKKAPNHYQNSPLFAKETLIAPKAMTFEFMLNALRLKQKIPLKLFEKRTLLNQNVLDEALKKPIAENLIEKNDNDFWVTPLGFQFLNDLQAMFL